MVTELSNKSTIKILRYIINCDLVKLQFALIDNHTNSFSQAIRKICSLIKTTPFLLTFVRDLDECKEMGMVLIRLVKLSSLFQTQHYNILELCYIYYCRM